MDTKTQTTPAPSDVDYNELHLICCDDNTGLCGAPLAGDIVDDPATALPDTALCRRCRYLRAELVPCGHPGCA